MTDSLRAGDPRQIGPYRLQKRLGEGGMGQVFLGRSPGGFSVAVKVVRAELAGDAGFRRRFAAEVELARKVGGIYTAQVVDADTKVERPWLATEYIPGPGLHEAVEERGPLPLESVAVLGAGLAEGLMAIHAHRIVHRDLKPANVILAENGPRVIDFGIARALDATGTTMTRAVIGTAGFMSPEQARGRTVAAPSDVFSLGCVLVYAATGRGPFGAGAAPAVVYRIVHEEPGLADVPGRLLALVDSCLAKEPESRPGLDQVLERLAALAGPARDRPTGTWLPSDVTEIITLRKTAIFTVAPEGGPRVPPDPGEQKVKEKPKPKPKPKPESKPKPKPKKPTPVATKKATPEPAKRPTPAAKRPATPVSTPGGTGAKEDDKSDDGEWTWIVVGAVVVAVLMYLSNQSFSLWVSDALNDGTDEIEVGNCIADVESDGLVEVPCFAAAAQFKVAAIRPLEPETGILDVEAGAFPVPVCSEVGAVRTMEVGGETVCLVNAS